MPREPEFLPEWYVRRAHWRSRRRAAVRAAAVVVAGAGLWLAASPRRSPGGVAATRGAGVVQEAPHVLAARAIDAVRTSLPPRVVVSSISTHSELCVTTIGLRFTADDTDAAECFAAELRARSDVGDVELKSQGEPNSFELRLSISAGGAR